MTTKKKSKFVVGGRKALLNRRSAKKKAPGSGQPGVETQQNAACVDETAAPSGEVASPVLEAAADIHAELLKRFRQNVDSDTRIGELVLAMLRDPTCTSSVSDLARLFRVDEPVLWRFVARLDDFRNDEVCEIVFQSLAFTYQLSGEVLEECGSEKTVVDSYFDLAKKVISVHKQAELEAEIEALLRR